VLITWIFNHTGNLEWGGGICFKFNGLRCFLGLEFELLPLSMPDITM
jgi:hypothetical protein